MTSAHPLAAAGQHLTLVLVASGALTSLLLWGRPLPIA